VVGQTEPGLVAFYDIHLGHVASHQKYIEQNEYCISSL